MRTAILTAALAALFACGATETQPDDPCEDGQTYAEPGCSHDSASDYAQISEGCFTACSGESDTCAIGTCTNAWTNPCICEEGADCCGACGGEQWLCL